MLTKEPTFSRFSLFCAPNWLDFKVNYYLAFSLAGGFKTAFSLPTRR
jgi:hypothetical protein